MNYDIYRIQGFVFLTKGNDFAIEAELSTYGSITEDSGGYILPDKKEFIRFDLSTMEEVCGNDLSSKTCLPIIFVPYLNNLGYDFRFIYNQLKIR